MKQTKRMLGIALAIVLLFVSTTVVMATETKILYGNLSEPVLEVTNVIGKDEVFSKESDYGILQESYL